MSRLINHFWSSCCLHKVGRQAHQQLSRRKAWPPAYCEWGCSRMTRTMPRVCVEQVLGKYFGMRVPTTQSLPLQPACFLLLVNAAILNKFQRFLFQGSPRLGSFLVGRMGSGWPDRTRPDPTREILETQPYPTREISNTSLDLLLWKIFWAIISLFNRDLRRQK